MIFEMFLCRQYILADSCQGYYVITNTSRILTDIYNVTKDITKTQAAAGHAKATMTLCHYVKGRPQKLDTANAVSTLYGLPESKAM